MVYEPEKRRNNKQAGLPANVPAWTPEGGIFAGLIGLLAVGRKIFLWPAANLC